MSKSEDAYVTDENMVKGRAEFRVWWNPQVGTGSVTFFYQVMSIEEGRILCDVLARYDAFQYENNIKPDYSNAGGVSWKHPDHTSAEWHDIEDPDDDYDEAEEIYAMLANSDPIDWGDHQMQSTLHH